MGLVRNSIFLFVALVIGSSAIANEQKHWAFRTPSRPSVPILDKNETNQNTIDAFTRARLQKEQLESSPEGDRRTLLRRVHLDLTGLPPTIAESEAFLRDESPGAYETLIERL